MSDSPRPDCAAPLADRLRAIAAELDALDRPRDDELAWLRAQIDRLVEQHRALLIEQLGDRQRIAALEAQVAGLRGYAQELIARVFELSRELDRIVLVEMVGREQTAAGTVARA